jgi:tetratricopeptide (TPR) repeat protein
MAARTLVYVTLAAGVSVGIACHRAGGSRGSAGPAGPGVAEEESHLNDADAFAARAYDRLCEGKYDRAVADYNRAIALDPTRATFWNARGFTWHMKGIGTPDRPACEDRALADYAEAIRIDPDYASALNNRAWLRATSEVEGCRDGKAAVAEATRACELTGWKNAGYLDTLSVACAEIGDFEQAVGWQRKALEDPGYVREESGNAKAKLALYAKRRPFRE